MLPPDPPRALKANTLHASCVTVQDRGLLIVGASGSGKSGLVLEMMALGAMLVADDRVILDRNDQDLIARVPGPIAGLIEMRGVGLLRAEHAPSTVISAVVDMDQVEQDRLPQSHLVEMSGLQVTLLKRVESPAFPASLMQYLKSGRHTP